MLFGYSIVTATLLVTFGRLSDMYDRVRLYNLGFAIYTVGSLLLYLTPNTDDAGALELIIFRIIKGVGGAFLFSNSAAIITDAFPPNERGKALGINQVAWRFSWSFSRRSISSVCLAVKSFYLCDIIINNLELNCFSPKPSTT